MAEYLPERILVVDDDAGIRECIADLLSYQGYEVWTAEDGLDALSLLHVTPPDVLISDLNMPNMSGFDLLPVVRRIFPHTLLIAMSAAYDGDAIPDGVVADAFVSKGQPDYFLSITSALVRSLTAKVRTSDGWARCGALLAASRHISQKPVLFCSDRLYSRPIT
jgi:CheY-like chemotaxis protein